MPETFPTTPRAPMAVRLGAVAIGLAAIVLATTTTITSLQWIGRVFPGFMLLDNRVIASVGLADWTGTAVPGLFQSEVLAVDGKRVSSTDEVYARVSALPAGTDVRYRLERGGVEREVTVPTDRFLVRDWFLLFGAFLLNGAVTFAAGLVPWLLRPRAPLPRALLMFGSMCALFLLTAMDLYGPARLFRLHVIGETFLPAAGIQLALLFPQPHPFARWRFAGYGLSALILFVYELSLYRPAAYSTVLTINMIYLGAAGLFFGARLVWEYVGGRSQLARQRVRVLTLGTLFGFALPGLIVFVSAIMFGGFSMNLAALTPFLFALSLAYAVVKQDLFEIDAMVKRGAYYLLLTGSVGASYVGAVVLFNLVLQAGAVTDSPAFPVLFTLAVLLVFNPLRTRLQAFVDRVFFRTRYDGAQVLAQVGGQLGATLQRDRIAALVRECVDTAIPNVGTRIFVGTPASGGLREIGGDDIVPQPLARWLATGRVATAFDPTEAYGDSVTHDVVRASMMHLEAEIAVPLRLREELVGALTAGPKRSRLFYTAGDAEFLRALAHQTAIALENARTYEALVELNARLEERVRERTAQLESANRELAEAYTELKNAEVQLVQAEKMASLGRLVAGVAHEINNPVSFIATSVAPLRRRLERALKVPPEDVAGLLREADDLVQIMARGAERTAAIVKDLRSFSRLGESRRKAADLHEGLEVSLRLLEPRWRDRITVHRDFGELPLVDCDPGQMNQVFMNVLSNACDAIEGKGNLWVTTRHEGGAVHVHIRDDGSGMPVDVMSRIFDPFFTTKDVGSGTGLGLAVSHSVIAAHGGKIDVESTPGHGATFRIVLPVDVSGVRLERAAGGSGS
jgi:signal transduction histidine kinase